MRYLVFVKKFNIVDYFLLGSVIFFIPLLYYSYSTYKYYFERDYASETKMGRWLYQSFDCVLDNISAEIREHIIEGDTEYSTDGLLNLKLIKIYQSEFDDEKKRYRIEAKFEFLTRSFNEQFFRPHSYDLFGPGYIFTFNPGKYELQGTIWRTVVKDTYGEDLDREWYELQCIIVFNDLLPSVKKLIHVGDSEYNSEGLMMARIDRILNSSALPAQQLRNNFLIKNLGNIKRVKKYKAHEKLSSLMLRVTLRGKYDQSAKSFRYKRVPVFLSQPISFETSRYQLQGTVYEIL